MIIQPLRDRKTRLTPFEVALALGVLAGLCFVAVRAPNLSTRFQTPIDYLMSFAGHPAAAPMPTVR